MTKDKVDELQAPLLGGQIPAKCARSLGISGAFLPAVRNKSAQEAAICGLPGALLSVQQVASLGR
jgi:hypothetical protein